MSIAEKSVYPSKPRVRVADLVGPHACTDEFTWETRGELLRYARAKTRREADESLAAIRARGIGPDEDLEATKYDSDPAQEAFEDADPYP